MKTLLTALLLLISTGLFAQNNLEEVVYLKNGSIIRGVIIEQIPNETLKIQTRDGNVFVYRFDEIEKITKETPLNPQYKNNSYSGNAIPPHIAKHRTGGIAATSIGAVFFAVGFPVFLVVEIISGSILTATSIPLLAIGPIKLGKYKRWVEENNYKGVYFTPSIQQYDANISKPGIEYDYAIGGTLIFKF